MADLVSVAIEDEGAFTAARGSSLLEAGLMNGFDMPHDCRAGLCGTCRVRVVSGAVAGGATGEPGAVLACQARITGALTIALDEVPEIASATGTVVAVTPLASDVVEVTIRPSRPWTGLPGQYARFQFRGFPARSFSPTAPLGGGADRGRIRLHVRLVPGGRVSGALGRAIGPGHKVRIVGPYGAAYLRPGTTGPLVLVASGTGFAPVWSIAHAALCEMPDRPIMVIAGARSMATLYFAQALLRLAAFPNVQVVPVLGTPHRTGRLPVGNPLDHLPPLSAADCVYVCGAPQMVRDAQLRAGAAGACCYADAFTPAPAERARATAARHGARASSGVRSSLGSMLGSMNALRRVNGDV